MIIPYEINPFQGAQLNTENLAETSDQFLQQLNQTLKELQKKNLQLAWLFLPLSRADLVAPAVSLGFSYHHADDTGLQLVFQLQPNAYIPGYATHYIGAGGVVIDDKNRILVIQERYHTRKHYKLPGGALDPGEHIARGVVREVLEETGIHTEFISLNCFRHWHGYRHGKSDIYFVCRLKPLSFEISMDPKEISEAVWMPVDEYLSQPDTHPFNRKIVHTTLTTRGLKIDDIPDYGTIETHELLF
ncbi:MAG: NUDIX domain-containing protein [Spirochaetes bacterium]|nr:NUDIX domain-containing protein [Spirochaetota bacterium]